MTDEKSADQTEAPAAGSKKDAAGSKKDAAGSNKDAAGSKKDAADSKKDAADSKKDAAADAAAGNGPEAAVGAGNGTDENELAADVTAAAGAAADVTENDAPEETAQELADRLAAATATIEELKDQALRARAEVENVRRRASRDVENAHKYALEKLAGKLLPVLDSLEKAIATGAAEDLAADAADAAGQARLEGVELSLKLFLGVLSEVGIVQIDPLGEPFDPQYHEAMALLENPAAEPNSVLEVMQKGYALNGRLVRPAMVVVSKAPAAAEDAESEDGS